MNTQYTTFIVRLRLDDNPNQLPLEARLSGSVQQVGLSQIRYFESIEKFQLTIQQTIQNAIQKTIDQTIQQAVEELVSERAQSEESTTYSEIY